MLQNALPRQQSIRQEPSSESNGSEDGQRKASLGLQEQSRQPFSMFMVSKLRLGRERTGLVSREYRLSTDRRTSGTMPFSVNSQSGVVLGRERKVQVLVSQSHG